MNDCKWLFLLYDTCSSKSRGRITKDDHEGWGWGALEMWNDDCWGKDVGGNDGMLEEESIMLN